MDEKQFARETLNKIGKKMEISIARNRHKIPSEVENGVYNDYSKEKLGWWTNGFWGGLMWQMHRVTGNEVFREEALWCEEQMEKVLLCPRDMNHDSGFRFLPTCYVNYALTGNVRSKERLILAADNLAGRFNLNGRFLRAWNIWEKEPPRTGWVIIDCMMNLPLLYRVGDLLKDPRYSAIATAHADTARENVIRSDGSACHIVSFDPKSGKRIESLGGQGYGHGSAWTRGQGWALYGFARTYHHTGEERFLETARKVASYVLSVIPESGLIPVDFCQPPEPAAEDSTAAATLACGFLELEKYVPEEEGKRYRAAALKLLYALDENRADYDPDTDGVLTHCTVAYHDGTYDHRLIYADFYYVEALMKLIGEEIDIW